MISDRFWELVSKQAFSEATDAELKELDQFVSSHPDLENIANSLNALCLHSLPAEKTNDLELAFEKHISRMNRSGMAFSENPGNTNPDVRIEVPAKKNKKQIKKWGILLASLVVVTSFFWILKNSNASSQHPASANASLNRVTTKPASKTQIQLPDGSTVWLNASSNLTYDKDFGKDLREVNLVGEAFFNVTKDPAHPFIIHTKVIDVKVLGTEFNVRAYPNDSYTETSLIRGRVEITVKNRPEEKHYLKPNEKMSVANNILDEKSPRLTKSEPIILTQPLSYAQTDSSIIETSWLNNRLIFQQNETFREVALKLERSYGVHINFLSEQVADEYRPFVSFKNETINQALDELREGYKFNYEITGDNITISQ